MRIQIREKDGVCLTLLFPTAVVTGLLSSRLAAKLIIKVLDQKLPARTEALPETPVDAERTGAGGEERNDFLQSAAARVQSALQPQTIRKIQKELAKTLRKNRHLTLVEVESADGDYVKIVL